MFVFGTPALTTFTPLVFPYCYNVVTCAFKSSLTGKGIGIKRLSSLVVEGVAPVARQKAPRITVKYVTVKFKYRARRRMVSIYPIQLLFYMQFALPFVFCVLYVNIKFARNHI